MKLSDYKKLITMTFANNTRRGYADWRDCGRLCMDVINCLEITKEELCAELRFMDLFALCSWAYVKWSNTDKDDSNGETQEFCGCVYDIWERIYWDGEQNFTHNKMLEGLLELLDGRVFDYLEDVVYHFILDHFKEEDELARKEQFLLNVMEGLKEQIPHRDSLKYSLYVKE